MSRFVEDESSWLKGPYVQVGLPFVSGLAEKHFFSTFETEHEGFSHQERSWQRLSSQHLSQHQAAHTLVATGTGSGKTECFLFPVLDHCARSRAAGEHGFKAGDLPHERPGFGLGAADCLSAPARNWCKLTT